MAEVSKSLQSTYHVLKARHGEHTTRSLGATGAGIVGNAVIGLGKLALGIVSLSFFTCVSALYTFGMVMAKCCALWGMLKTQTKGEQYRYYTLSGIILIVTSLLYMGYSARLFFHPVTGTYHMVVALAIATFTFVEIALNIRGVAVERHNRAPLVHAIKMLNLASSLICLTLTQAAILSFASAEVGVHAAANAAIGLATGTLAMALGIFMVVRTRKMQAKTYPGGTYDDPYLGGGGRHKTEPERLYPPEQQRV